MVRVLLLVPSTNEGISFTLERKDSCMEEGLVHWAGWAGRVGTEG